MNHGIKRNGRNGNTSRETDQIYQWGYEEGRKIGYEEIKRETAISMAELGISIEQIAKVVKEDAELVQKWIAEKDGSGKMNAICDETL